MGGVASGCKFKISDSAMCAIYTEMAPNINPSNEYHNGPVIWMLLFCMDHRLPCS